MGRQIGTYESAQIIDPNSAQDYYQGREITERRLRGDFKTTYGSEYKKFRIPPKHRPISAPSAGTFGKTGKTSYEMDYPGYNLPPPPLAGPGLPPKSTAKMSGQTTYSTGYLRPPTPNKHSYAKQGPPIDLGHRPFSAHTAYGDAYNKKTPARVTARPTGPEELPSPAFTATTTYSHEFPYKEGEGGPIKRPPERAPRQLPFKATTTHGSTFKGWKLPPKRYDLGVETVGDTFHVLIPKSKSVPAQATHVFSTHRDNQENACILVLEGQNSRASRNRLLGQFDMTKIPPAPRQQPQIEVTFKVDRDNVLTVEGKDLDVNRHKAWTEKGGAVVVR